MADIRRYVIENTDGSQTDDYWEEDELQEARAAAAKHGQRCALVALIFEYSDSELVDVFEDGRCTGEDVFERTP